MAHSDQEPLYFRPPPGGDVILCSSDGIKFSVHSVILSMVSSVFRDMLVVGTAGEDRVTNLTGNGQTVSLMLQFIYPIHQPPTIHDPVVLRSCLEVARKYDLNAMLGNVDAQVSQSASNMFPDAFELYTLGAEYNIPRSRAAAAHRLLGGAYDFLDPAKLSPVLSSDKNMMALAAIQGARYKILTEVLLDFDAVHMVELLDYPGLSICCEQCRKNINDEDNDVEAYSPPPGWVMQWAAAAHKALATAPLEQNLRFFDAGIFDSFHSGSDIACSSCLACLWGHVASREEFNTWVRSVKNILETRLAALEPLYLLC